MRALSSRFQHSRQADPRTSPRMGHARRTSSTASAPAGRRVRLWGTFRVKQTIRPSCRSPRTRMGDAVLSSAKGIRSQIAAYPYGGRTGSGKPRQIKPFRGIPHPRGNRAGTLTGYPSAWPLSPCKKATRPPLQRCGIAPRPCGKHPGSGHGHRVIPPPICLCHSPPPCNLNNIRRLPSASSLTPYCPPLPPL